MASPARGLSALLLFSLPFSLASPKKPASAARKEDTPFIRCQVCEKTAHQIYHQVEKKAARIAPKKVLEFEIIEIAENVCNLKKQQADWMLHIDIVEKGDKLELVEQGTECDAIQNVRPSSVLVKRIEFLENLFLQSQKDAEIEKILRAMEVMPLAPSMKCILEKI